MPLFFKRSPKMLITRTDRIGDLILSTPVFSELRKKFPDAWIACLTFLENREIVLGNPYLNEVILYDKQGSEKGIFGNLKFARKIASRKFDVVIHLHATNRMHWVGWLAGIPVRIGWDRRCPWTLTHAYPDQKKEGLKHEAEYNFDLLEPLGMNVPRELETFFPIHEKARRSLSNLLKYHRIPKDKPWVIFNPSASCPSKRWPPSRFGELANLIAQKYQVAFIVIGTEEDRSFIEKLKQISSEPVYDLSGRLNLGMLGVLLQDSALLVSNDSGPVHIASAHKVPVISIFGRKEPGLSPIRWRPLGDRAKVVWINVGCMECLAHRCQIHFLCLDVISACDVMQEVEKFADRLNGGVQSSRPAYAGRLRPPLHH